MDLPQPISAAYRWLDHDDGDHLYHLQPRVFGVELGLYTYMYNVHVEWNMHCTCTHIP